MATTLKKVLRSPAPLAMTIAPPPPPGDVPQPGPVVSPPPVVTPPGGTPGPIPPFSDVVVGGVVPGSGGTPKPVPGPGPGPIEIVPGPPPGPPAELPPPPPELSTSPVSGIGQGFLTPFGQSENQMMREIGRGIDAYYPGLQSLLNWYDPKTYDLADLPKGLDAATVGAMMRDPLLFRTRVKDFVRSGWLSVDALRTILDYIDSRGG